MPSVVFDRESARRIGRAVREVLANAQPVISRRSLPSIQRQTRFIGKTDADHAIDTQGTISIWRRDPLTEKLEDTGENIENVWLDWMHGEEQVSSGKEVVIEFFDDEQLWRIVQAECE